MKIEKISVFRFFYHKISIGNKFAPKKKTLGPLFLDEIGVQGPLSARCAPRSTVTRMGSVSETYVTGIMVGPIRRISCSKLQQLGSDHLVLSGDMLQSRGLENYSTMRVQDVIPEPHSVLSYPTSKIAALLSQSPVIPMLHSVLSYPATP